VGAVRGGDGPPSRGWHRSPYPALCPR
jgi:hypothetical protein